MSAAGQRDRLEQEASRLRARLPSHPMRYLYILMAVGAVDAADRTIFATVIEDIKHAFSVSDSELGILSGAYAVVASLSVIPFGWLADRGNRVRLIALGFIPWSIGMVLTGLSTSFAMMFGARLLLGTIEATNGPATPSLLGDYYPVGRRSRVMGVYVLGALVGALMGFALAGVIASIFGWRASFFVWGAAGLVCAAVVIRTLPEPERGVADALFRVEERLARDDAPDDAPDDAAEVATGPLGAEAASDYRTMGLRASTREILRVRTMWFVLGAAAAGDFLMGGLSLWAPTFFRRYHGQSAAGAGIVTALLALSLVVGIVIGSRLGDRYLARGRPQARIWLAAGANLATFVVFVPAFAIGSFAAAVPFFLATGFTIGVPMPIQQTIYLDVFVPHLRGRASAVRSLLRAGATALAPVTFGFLSDAVGLRAAFLYLAPCMAVSAAITLLALRSYPADMDRAQSEALRQSELEDSVLA